MVTTLVQIPLPGSLGQEQAFAAFNSLAPTFKNVPGLIRKYFTLSDSNEVGGVYLWEDRNAAETFHSEAWRSRILSTYGSEAKVTYFASPVIVDNSK
jgi:heme-degrading monooxygenase HmoA